MEADEISGCAVRPQHQCRLENSKNSPADYVSISVIFLHLDPILIELVLEKEIIMAVLDGRSLSLRLHGTDSPEPVTSLWFGL